MQSSDSSSIERTPRQQPRLAHSFSQVAAATIASKIVGLIRDMIIGRAYGTSIVADAYQYAFQLTGNFFVMFGGLGGPFDSSAVTVLDGKSEAQRPAIVWKVLKSTFYKTLVLMLIVYLVAPFVIPIGVMLYKPRAGMSITTEHARNLLAHEFSTQLYIMLPMLLIAGLLGILYGIAHIKNKVLLPSLAPAVQSVVIILGVSLAWQKFGITSGWPLAAATMLGALLQFVVQIPGNLPTRVVSQDLDTVQVNDAVKEYKRTILPSLLSSSVGQLSSYIDMGFTLTMGAGAWTALSYSNRLVQLPLGVLVTAMIVPMLPRFTQAAMAGDRDGLQADFERSVRFLWFTILPILAVFYALAKPIVSVLYEGGKFNSDSVELVTTALLFQLPSMFFYVARDLMTRVFYAFRYTDVVFRVACFALVLKSLLDGLFVYILKMDVAGISLATTLVTATNFAVVSYLLKSKVKLDLGRLVRPTSGMLLASAACWAVTSITFPHVAQLATSGSVGNVSTTTASLLHRIMPFFTESRLVSLTSIGTASGMGFLTYAAICWMLRIEDLRLIVSQLSRRNS